MRARLLIVVCLAAGLLAGGLPAAAPVGAGELQRLSATKAKLAQVRQDIAAAKGRRSGAAAALAEAQRQLAVVLEAVGEAQAAVERQQAAVDAALATLAGLQQREAAQRNAMTARVVSLYKNGSADPFTSLLAARSPGEVVTRSAYVAALSRVEQQSFEGLRAAAVAVGAQREVLEAERAALQQVLDEQRAILAEVDALRQERALALAATDAELARLKGQEQHLEAESRALAAVARRASRTVGTSRSAAAAAPARAAGGWVWPAQGPVTSGYGRRWGRMHEGIDIGAPSGAPIVAARGGTVSYAGRMSGYGNIVLVDHGGGIVTAYAHQSRILVRVGQAVGTGERIGLVGSTGRSTGPHLHFEVRVNGSPRNPRAYLG